MSSTFENKYARFAVNNYYYDQVDYSSCSQTTKENNPMYYVDLGESYYIKSVNVIGLD